MISECSKRRLGWKTNRNLKTLDLATQPTLASRSPHVGCVRYARTRSPFSLQPQPTACVPCGTHPTDGFKGRLKKRSRHLFHLLFDKKLPEKFLPLIFWWLFFRRPFAFLCCTGRLKTSLKTSDKRNQTQNDTGGVCQYDGVVAFFFQKAVGKP